MEYRRLGKTGRDVSVIGFGAWAIGADWGTVDDADSLRALHAAADAGVTLIDTADVYGDGRSERVIRRFLRRAGRASRSSSPPRWAAARPWTWPSYTPEAFRGLDGPQPREPRRGDASTSSSSTASTRPSTTARSTSRRSTSWWRPAPSPPTASAWRRSRRPSRRSSSRASPPSRSSSTCSASDPRTGSSPRPRAATWASSRACRSRRACSPASSPPPRRSRPTDHRLYNRHGESFDVGETFAGVDYETGLERGRGAQGAGARRAPRWPRRRCAGS